MTIESAVRAQLLNLSAVTAVVGDDSDARIRPHKLWQKDNLKDGPAIMVVVNREEDQNDLNCEGGLVIADVSVMCVAQENDAARQLARAVKTNGTIPGTGLAHSEWNLPEAPLQVDSCCYTYTECGFVFYNDSSDEGYYYADCHYTIIYAETI